MYIRKQRDKWRVEIERLGVRKSAVFATKTEAREWGVKEEGALIAVKRGVFPNRTFNEAIDKYIETVSAHKEGERAERLRFQAIRRDYPLLTAKVLHRITTADMCDWRDARLSKVSKGSVQRDINLISHLFTKARDEWKWMGETPFKGMEAPGDNAPRERLPTSSEIRRLLRWMGYITGEHPITATQEAGFAYMLALRTGMRASEILQLGPLTVKGSVATVKHKMQYRTRQPRKVPLSRHAVRLLKGFKGFNISDGTLSTTFGNAHRALLIKGLTFHDARAHALTRFSRKVDVLELARISGHKDLRVLLNTYYRASSEEIASRL